MTRHHESTDEEQASSSSNAHADEMAAVRQGNHNSLAVDLSDEDRAFPMVHVTARENQSKEA